MNPLAALYAAHADRMAAENTANAPDRFWCTDCGRHRVRARGQACPVCEEEG